MCGLLTMCSWFSSICMLKVELKSEKVSMQLRLNNSQNNQKKHAFVFA